METKIIPSVIASSQKELVEKIEKVMDFVDYIHLDIFDGVFVPNKSLDFDFRLPEDGPKFEAHLMIQSPDKWVRKNWQKVDTILAPIESCKHPKEIIDFLKDKKNFGFVLNPETELETIKKYLDQINQVLIMTVKPGFYGSEFLPETLEKVRDLRKIRPGLNVEVDGGINPETIKKAKNAGANLLVSGSYIMHSEDPKTAFNNLWQALEN